MLSNAGSRPRANPAAGTNICTAPTPHQSPHPSPPYVDVRAIPSIANDRNAAAIISSITSQIRDEDHLLSDGTNYMSWKDFIEERLRDAINNPDYLCFRSYNATQKRIVQSIMLSLVDRSFRRALSRLGSAHEMYLDITACFTTISREAQLNHFKCLLHFNIRNHPTTATIGPVFDEVFDALGQMNITLNCDKLAGIILQNSLHNKPETMLEVDCCIEQSIPSSRHNRLPNFDSIVCVIAIARQNIAHRCGTTLRGDRAWKGNRQPKILIL